MQQPLSLTSEQKEKTMRRIKIIAMSGFILAIATGAQAQSAGTGAGATAGGSSASGGPAASSTTTGSSLNGSTTGNNGPSQGLSPSNSTDIGRPASNAVGSSATVPGHNGAGGTGPARQ